MARARLLLLSLLAVTLLGIANAPSVFEVGHLSWERVAAAHLEFLQSDIDRQFETAVRHLDVYAVCHPVRPQEDLRPDHAFRADQPDFRPPGKAGAGSCLTALPCPVLPTHTLKMHSTKPKDRLQLRSADIRGQTSVVRVQKRQRRARLKFLTTDT